METATAVTLASAVALAATAADGTAVNLPANVTSLALEIAYTRDGSSTTGYPRIGLKVDCGAGARSLAQMTGSSAPLTLEAWSVQPATAASIALVVEVPLPPGAQSVQATYYDAGDGTNRGTLTLRATPRVGA